MQQIAPVETVLGYLRGRDAIYLRHIRFEYRTTLLILEGFINSRLCSQKQSEMEYEYKLQFINVLAMKLIEIDSWQFVNQSSFDEVIHSDWIRQLGGKVTDEHRHFIVQTYDDVFEVICENFAFEITQTEC